MRRPEKLGRREAVAERFMAVRVGCASIQSLRVGRMGAGGDDDALGSVDAHPQQLGALEAVHEAGLGDVVGRSKRAVGIVFADYPQSDRAEGGAPCDEC